VQTAKSLTVVTTLARLANTGIDGMMYSPGNRMLRTSLQAIRELEIAATEH